MKTSGENEISLEELREMGLARPRHQAVLVGVGVVVLCLLFIGTTMYLTGSCIDSFVGSISGR